MHVGHVLLSPTSNFGFTSTFAPCSLPPLCSQTLPNSEQYLFLLPIRIVFLFPPDQGLPGQVVLYSLSLTQATCACELDRFINNHFFISCIYWYYLTL